MIITDLESLLVTDTVMVVVSPVMNSGRDAFTETLTLSIDSLIESSQADATTTPAHTVMVRKKLEFIVDLNVGANAVTPA
ncbi:MAG: hypothetical protein ABI852_15960 [Gemmatimonadaceae bacterium]